jgi:hypothetical protein
MEADFMEKELRLCGKCVNFRPDEKPYGEVLFGDCLTGRWVKTSHDRRRDGCNEYEGRVADAVGQVLEISGA